MHEQMKELLERAEAAKSLAEDKKTDAVLGVVFDLLTDLVVNTEPEPAAPALQAVE